MSDDPLTIEERVATIARELQLLTAKVDRLALRIDSTGPSSEFVRGQDALASTGPGAPFLPRSSWTGATILAGAATVCFLLVVALTLRTLVDSEIIDQPAGAAAGLVYASLVLLYGYYLARAKRRFASLSTVCGVTLVFAIVIETHYRFKLLSSTEGYAILAATLAVMLVAGLRYHAYGPLNVAIPGLCVAAMRLDFPDPDFVYLGCILALGVVAAYSVTPDPRTRWLVWCMLAFMGFYWVWWTQKLRIPLLRHVPLNPAVGEEWFLPGLALFVLIYACQASYAALRPMRPMGVFECAVPAVTGIGAYLAARAVMAAQGRPILALGWAGVATSLAFVALALLLAHRDSKSRSAATWFAVASLMLFALIAPEIAPTALVALAGWAIAAVAFSIYGRGRLDHAVPIATILLQIYACVFGAVHGVFGVRAASPFTGVATLAGLSMVCIYHYAVLRRDLDASREGPAALPASARLFAISVFFVALIYAFGAARLTLYAVLESAMDDPWRYFECGQSMLINLGALLLAILALKRMRKDLLATAGVVAVLGMVKVFAYDLLRIQGIPLVLSVFTFGITTTAGSLLWNRWQRLASPEIPRSADSARAANTN